MNTPAHLLLGADMVVVLCGQLDSKGTIKNAAPKDSVFKTRYRSI